MKTTKCRYCGKQVPVQPNQRVKPHVVGKQRCIGGGMHPTGYRHKRPPNSLKPKRALRHDTI